MESATKSTENSLVQPETGPRGPVLLVEPQTPHIEFLQGNPYTSTVLVRLHEAARLVRQGHTADSYFPDGLTVIVTSTVNDDYLSDLDWRQERRIVREFQPDYHIPCDYPVYRTQEPETRKEYMDKCFKGTYWFSQQFDGSEIGIIPLFKAVTDEERQRCYSVLEFLGTDYCAFYGTQYFTQGPGFTSLRDDLRKVASENPGLRMLLIGLLAPDRLAELPPQVVAAAGQNQWLTRCLIPDIPMQQARERLGELNDEVVSALDTGQAPIGMWLNQGWEVSA